MWATAGCYVVASATEIQNNECHGRTEIVKEGALEMTDEKKTESTDQRRAVEAAYEKLIKDLHAYSENPLPPEEVLKRFKEKGQTPTQSTARKGDASSVTSLK